MRGRNLTNQLKIKQIFLLPVLPSGTLTPDLLGDGEETADDKGTVGVGLTPGLDLTTVLGVVSDDEESCQQIADEG